MTRITEHFTKEEMERSSTAIRLGLQNECPQELLANMLNVANHLEVIRAHFGKSIHVTSCYRAPEVNAAVGGSKTSAHRFAHAADFEVYDTDNLSVCEWIAENMKGFDQVIYEFGPTGWVHLGFTNGKPREQKLTATKESGKTVYRDGLIA